MFAYRSYLYVTFKFQSAKIAENQNKSTTLVSIQVIYRDKICIAKYNQNTKIQLKKGHKRIAGGKIAGGKIIK